MEKARAEKLEAKYNNIDIDLLHMKFLEQRTKIEEINRKLIIGRENLLIYEKELNTIYSFIKKFDYSYEVKRELIAYR